jgi:hypothetical protein
VVDWESAGWEDPAVLVCDFLLHETTRGLAGPLQNLFAETYFAAHPPSAAELARWRQVYFLVQVGWILGFLNAFRPEYLARKRFATPDLDVDAFQADRVAKLRAHLERVVDSPPDPLLG